MYVPHFVYPFIIDGHLSYLYLLAVVNEDAVDIGVQMSVPVPAFRSSARNGIALPHGNYMFNF